MRRFASSKWFDFRESLSRHWPDRVPTLASVLVSGLILQAICAPHVMAEPDPRPNIVLIMADDK